MYTQFWQLNAKPFESFAGPRFYCQLGGQHAASEKLRYSLVDQSGFCLLTGLSGTGKTELVKNLIHAQEKHFGHILWVGQPYFEMQDLLWKICQLLLTSEEEKATAASQRPGQMLELLRQAWMSLEKPVLIVVDDAQAINDAASLGLLKALMEWGHVPTSYGQPQSDLSSGPQSANKARISVLLVGHPLTVSALEKSPELTDVLSMHVGLPCLTRPELEIYLQRRLQVAGRVQNCFSERAVDELFRLSAGILRRINQLADLSLLVGYVKQVRMITETEVFLAAREMMLEQAA